MTGLDKIIEEIKTEAASNAEAVISQARSEAELIISASREEGKAQSAKILENAKKRSADIINRGASSACLEKQRSMLVAKQQVIGDMLQSALEHIESLPDEEYFSLILKLAEKNSLPEKGEIAFSGKDLKRLPPDFMKNLGGCVKGELTLSKNAVKISSGFILIYGGIEENCSFESLLHSSLEELTDEISALLFSN